MNEIQIFNNPEFGDIRILMIKEEPWFVGKDVAVALGYKDSVNAIKSHIDDEDKMGWQNATSPIFDSLGRPQKAILINESGLYSLILSSKLPAAKRFKRWITSDVLPTLRKTGKYELPVTQEEEAIEQRTLTIDDYLRAASIVAACKNERVPTVLALLKKGGIEVPTLEELHTERDEIGETAALINQAINEYGLNQNRIANLCGLKPTQIMRIRTGQQKPKMAMARIIQDAIQGVIANAEKTTIS